MGNVLDGAGGAKWTPRATAPIQAMTRMSFQNVENHTRKGGDVKGSEMERTVVDWSPEILRFSRG